MATQRTMPMPPETEPGELTPLARAVEANGAGNGGGNNKDPRGGGEKALARREEALARRLKDFLAETQAERSAIKGELEAVLTGSQGSESEG